MSEAVVDPQAARDARRRAVLLVAGSGIAHALLFLVSYGLLTSSAGASATDEELRAFYGSENRNRLILVGLYVMPFAGIAFLWFTVTLRAWMRHGSPQGADLLSGVQLVSGVLYVGLFFAAAASTSVMAVSVEFAQSAVDPMVERQFPQYGRTLLLVFVMRMAAMFVLTTSRIGRITGMLPRWFAYLGVLVGLALLLSAPFSRVLVLVFPAWQLVLCVLLLARAWRLPDDARDEKLAASA